MTGVRRLLFPGRVIIVMMDSCFRRNDRGGAGMTGGCGAGMTGVRRLLFPGRVIIVMMDSCFRRNDRGGAGMTGGVRCGNDRGAQAALSGESHNCDDGFLLSQE